MRRGRYTPVVLLLALPVFACSRHSTRAGGAAPAADASDTVSREQHSIEVVERCDQPLTELGALGKGRLAREEVRAVFRGAQPRFDACLHTALARGALLDGNLALAFVVGDGGKVLTAWADEGTSTVSDAGFTCCIVGAVRRIVFPEPEGGTVLGRYSLRLTNGSGGADSAG